MRAKTKNKGTSDAFLRQIEAAEKRFSRKSAVEQRAACNKAILDFKEGKTVDLEKLDVYK